MVRSISIETKPSFSVTSVIEFSTIGATFGISFIVKLNTSSTNPPFPSLAVTVMFDDPIPVSVTVNVLSETLTVTTDSFAETAE